MEEGTPKLWVMTRTLELRRRRPDLFDRRAAYRPLAASGPRADHVVAFARSDGVVAVVPRLTAGRGAAWGATRLPLPTGRWSSLLGGEEQFEGRVRLGDILGRFPVALLEAVDEVDA
jgi:(1->4)-alpha-D-glucan 1-alpha-D-glucosylmutase